MTLPIGLPWIGANFRLDALSAFFAVVVNLGGAAASLYAIGYGRHEREPARVLPFFPAFLAGMNLVLIADDAYTFLVSWEFMSLASWALVMAHHREAGNQRAGFVYIVMASFGDAVRCCSPSACSPARAAAMRSPPCARRRPSAGVAAPGAGAWRSSAPARRPASRRCTSGCRSPIPPRRATSRR